MAIHRNNVVAQIILKIINLKKYRVRINYLNVSFARNCSYFVLLPNVAYVVNWSIEIEILSVVYIKDALFSKKTLRFLNFTTGANH